MKKEFTPKLKFQRAGKYDQQTSHSVINVIMFSDSVDITSQRINNSSNLQNTRKTYSKYILKTEYTVSTRKELINHWRP